MSLKMKVKQRHEKREGYKHGSVDTIIVIIVRILRAFLAPLLSSTQSKQSRNLAVESEVPAARPDIKRDVSRGTNPALTNDVPDREVVARKSDRDCLHLSCLEIDILEALQDGWWLVRGGWMVHVELGDFGAGDAASVRD